MSYDYLTPSIAQEKRKSTTRYDFTTTTHGKWILAGEHAVVRGHPALVFPLTQKTLTLRYQACESELSAHYSGISGADIHLLFWSVLEQGIKLLGYSLNQIHGIFHLDSNIPVGVGLGASAALCVAVARWFAAYFSDTRIHIAEFARELEHLFHGKSSGVDIAGASAVNGMYFKAGEYRELQQTWAPIWFLSSCDQIGITTHCIEQVQQLWENNSSLAQTLDDRMTQSVNAAIKALSYQSETALLDLAEAINRASDCFYQWGLVSDNLHQHMKHLIKLGAIAVKPTGSGGGGYVLSLWQTPPHPEHQKLFIM